MVGGLFLGLWIYLKCVNFSRSYVSFVSCSSYFFFGGGGIFLGLGIYLKCINFCR